LSIFKKEESWCGFDVPWSAEVLQHTQPCSIKCVATWHFPNNTHHTINKVHDHPKYLGLSALLIRLFFLIHNFSPLISKSEKYSQCTFQLYLSILFF
jgi:hypothetical protein